MRWVRRVYPLDEPSTKWRETPKGRFEIEGNVLSERKSGD